MKKYLVLLLITLLSLTSCATAFQSDLDQEPSWYSSPTRRRGSTAFTSRGEGPSSDIAYSAAATALLEQVSAYLGYDVTGRYYRELTARNSVADIGLTITNEVSRGNYYYLLAYADTELLNSARPESYSQMLERENEIKKLKAEAMGYYRNNMDVEAIRLLLQATAIAASGVISDEECSVSALLSQATEWVSPLEIRILKENPEAAEAELKVIRKRGVFNPGVANAKLNASFSVRRGTEDSYIYSFPIQTDADGLVSFKEFYPYAENEAVVLFSLNFDDELEALSKALSGSEAEDFLSALELVSASFAYSKVSQASGDGILLYANGYDERGEMTDSNLIADIMISFLEKEGITAIEVDSEYEDFEDIYNDIKRRYDLNYDYLIFVSAGCAVDSETPSGDLIWVCDGVAILFRFDGDEIIASDSNTRTLYWGTDREEAYEKVFTNYANHLGKYFAPYL